MRRGPITGWCRLSPSRGRRCRHRRVLSYRRAGPGSFRYDGKLLPFLEKHFRLLTAVPILLMAGLLVRSILQESATFDEAVHLAAGYRYWKIRKFNMNVEHPPLQKLLCAAPLLWVEPPIPTDEKLLIDQSEYARAFIYE